MQLHHDSASIGSPGSLAGGSLTGASICVRLSAINNRVRIGVVYLVWLKFKRDECPS